MIDHGSVHPIFDQLGPTPRICVDYLCDHVKMAQYRHALETEIKDLKTSELEKLVEDAASLTMNTVSHKICLISRQDKENVHSPAIISPMTSFIKSKLANRFRALGRHEQIRLYKHFAKVPASKGLAGIFFEAAGQRRLQDGITLEIVPVVRLSSSRRGTDPQWYSSHSLLRNPELEASRQNALQQRQFLQIPSCSPIEYPNDGPSSIISNIIYLPELTNQVAVDSFIVINGLLYVLQFAIGGDHGIKPGLVDFIGKCPGLPSIDNWRFIFIHPPNYTLVCPQPWRLELRKLQPYSAVLDL